MKYECPASESIQKRMTEMAAEILALRAAVAAVAALLPDSPPFGMVRVVDIWDALHDVTEHKCSAGDSQPDQAAEHYDTEDAHGNPVCVCPDINGEYDGG